MRGCSRGSRWWRRRAAASSGFRPGGGPEGPPPAAAPTCAKYQVDEGIKSWPKPKKPRHPLFTWRNALQPWSPPPAGLRLSQDNATQRRQHVGAGGRFSGWPGEARSEAAPEACREPQERLSKWPGFLEASGLCWDRPGPTCLRRPSDTSPRAGTAAAAGCEVAMVTGDSLHAPTRQAGSQPPAHRLPGASLQRQLSLRQLSHRGIKVSLKDSKALQM